MVLAKVPNESKVDLMPTAALTTAVEPTAAIQRTLTACSWGLESATNGRNAGLILRAKRGNSRGRKVLHGR